MIERREIETFHVYVISKISFEMSVIASFKETRINIECWINK